MPHFIEQKKKDEIVSRFFERKKGSGISLLGFINIYSWRHRPRFGGAGLVLEAQPSFWRHRRSAQMDALACASYARARGEGMKENNFIFSGNFSYDYYC